MRQVTVADAADIVGVHHRVFRSWIERAPEIEIGNKPAGRIYFCLREVVAMAIARELISAGYLPHEAIRFGLITVESYSDPPEFNDRAAFPLPGAVGAMRTGSDVLCGQIGSKIVLDLASIWAGVAKKFAGYAGR